MKLRAGLALLLVAALAACGNSSNLPNGSVVNSPGGTPSPAPQIVNATLTVNVPKPTSARASHYMSSKTQSITVGLAAVGGTGVSNATATTLDVGRNVPGCKEFKNGVTCTGVVEASPGSDLFNVTTFAGREGNGPVLSTGSITVPISGGGGHVKIDRVALTLLGVAAALKLTITPPESNLGKAASAQVSLTAFDAGGAAIVGASDYSTPVSITIQGDTAKAFSLHYDGKTSNAATVDKPGAMIELAYDGNNAANSVSLQATSPGSTTVTANATYTLKGTVPPPVASEIYVLNAGANEGQGATVTVYAANATGNATPKRTLSLDKKLYAQSVALDPQGRLYVGYFDTPTGASIINGSPDAGNVIEVYSSGASGTAAPVAKITQAAGSGTLLFPIGMAFDATGELVTYGATKVDGNAGNDGVLIYAAGAANAATPANAWGYFSPFFRYPGPTGIVLDAAGNFYVAGTLKTNLAPQSGVFVAAASDKSNPNANPARTLPWDSGTHLVPTQAAQVGLDQAGEILVGNFTAAGTTSCQAAVNLYAAGATGGQTDIPPLRTVVISGFLAKNASCLTSGDYLAAHFPSLAVFGAYAYAGDDFNNAIVAYPVTDSGNVNPPQLISGSATGLDAPIAIVVAPSPSASPLQQVSARDGHAWASSQETPR